MNFELHPQLAKDCFIIGQSELNLLLLLNDSQYPWCILVPKRENLREIYQLTTADLTQFWQESNALSQTLNKAFSADKMNVAALGNMVPQLHIHHIARFTTDKAWPGPVWGKVPAKPYEEDEKQAVIKKLQPVIDERFSF